MNKPIIFNPGIRLSEHFRLGEFTKSITAERLRIVNEPGYEQILALRPGYEQILALRHICKRCWWTVYGRRLRERYILKQQEAEKYS